MGVEGEKGGRKVGKGMECEEEGGSRGGGGGREVGKGMECRG